MHTFLLCFKRSPFYLGTIVRFVAMRQFNGCLPVGLNIFLGYKSLKNWSILTKFWYVFEVSNINLCIKNFDRPLDIFYRSASKSWIFFHLSSAVNKFMWQYLCHNKNGFYYGFLRTIYSFKIWYRDTRKGFEKSRNFFHKSF